MITRRTLGVLGSMAGATLAAPARAAPDRFETFLGGVRAEARRAGVSAAVLDRALTGLRPNAKVIELDHYQPEFTLTWARYRASRLSDTRIAAGRAAWGQTWPVLQSVQQSYGVDPRVIVGIWGLESNYGSFTGGFNVIEALATLAFEGRRASFFRPELIAALLILQHGDVTFERMKGSYAGAMGQPQFMPTSFTRLAVDFTGDGRRDIWDNRADVLASIANYLARSGWRDGQGWGEQVRLPADFDTGLAGRDRHRPLAEWSQGGVRRLDGRELPQADLPASLILPDGASGEAFLAYPNFAAIRRYNPSDYYALSVGLLGDLVAG